MVETLTNGQPFKSRPSSKSDHFPTHHPVRFRGSAGICRRQDVTPGSLARPRRQFARTPSSTATTRVAIARMQSSIVCAPGTAVTDRWPGRAPGSVEAAAAQPRTRPALRSSGRSSTCGRTVTSVLRRSPCTEALSRRRDQQFRGVADPQARGHVRPPAFPAANRRTTQAEAVRKADTWPPAANRRRVHRPARSLDLLLPRSWLALPRFVWRHLTAMVVVKISSSSDATAARRSVQTGWIEPSMAAIPS